jgi:hypothetical protein
LTFRQCLSLGCQKMAAWYNILFLEDSDMKTNEMEMLNLLLWLRDIIRVSMSRKLKYNELKSSPSGSCPY